MIIDRFEVDRRLAGFVRFVSVSARYFPPGVLRASPARRYGVHIFKIDCGNDCGCLSDGAGRCLCPGHLRTAARAHRQRHRTLTGAVRQPTVGRPGGTARRHDSTHRRNLCRAADAGLPAARRDDPLQVGQSECGDPGRTVCDRRAPARHGIRHHRRRSHRQTCFLPSHTRLAGKANDVRNADPQRAYRGRCAAVHQDQPRTTASTPTTAWSVARRSR